MARSETASIVIQIRGGLKAAAEARAVAEGMGELGDETDQAGRDALQAATAWRVLEKRLKAVQRQEILTAAATGLLSAQLLALKAATLGTAVIAMPLLIGVLGAATVAVLSMAAAVGGLGLGIAAMAGGAVMRFKETADIAGSAANRLRQQAGLLKDAFADATAAGSTQVLAGLIPVLRGARGLVKDLEPAFTSLGTAMGDALRWFGDGLRELGPELSRMFRAIGPAMQPLAEVALTFLSVFARVATEAMPYLVRGLQWMADGLRGIQQSITDGAIVNAFDAVGASVRVIGRFIDGIADTLGPILGPAAREFSQTFGASARVIGNVVGSVLGALVQLSQGVLPGITSAMRTLAPLFAEIGESGLFQSIGQALGKGIAFAARMVVKLVDALRPAEPFFTNVLGPFARGVIKALGDTIELVIPIIGLIAQGLGKVGTILAPLKGVFETAGRVIGTVFAGSILRVIGLVGGPLGVVFRTAGTVINVILGVIGRAVGLIGRAIGRLAGIFGGITRAIAQVVGPVAGAIGRVISAITSPFRAIGAAVLPFVRGAIGDVIDFLKGIPGKAMSAASSIGKGIGDGLKTGVVGAVNWVIGKINWLIRRFNDIGGLLSKLPGVPDLTIGQIDKILTPSQQVTKSINDLAGTLGVTVGQATGGTTQRAGWSWVGERGPELQWQPAGTTTVDHRTSAQVTRRGPTAGAAALAGASAGPEMVELHTHVHADGREFAEIVQRHRLRQAAIA
ncbi:MAG: hypothetical protein AB7G37_00955 [Solirubrobacteraceae bacterium]